MAPVGFDRDLDVVEAVFFSARSQRNGREIALPNGHENAQFVALLTHHRVEAVVRSRLESSACVGGGRVVDAHDHVTAGLDGLIFHAHD